jgi:RimJ/RimL family protein N-acetyltransferase
MTEILGYDLRYSQPSDLDYLKRWLSSDEMLHWFPMQETKEMEDAAQCWIGYARFSASLTATLDGVPCGIGTLFLMPYRKVAHHCQFKIIVDPQYQKKGIGASLLKNLKHLAKNYFHLEKMHIEIFEGNPILSLLKKYGFREYARQQRFVKENGNYLARILLECDL